MNIELAQKIIEGLQEAQKLKKIPAFAYDRVSTIEQANQGLSLEYQGNNAEIYARNNDLHIVHSFTVAESAKAAGRKVFNQMLELAQQFKVGHLIFKCVDRMSRNHEDLSLILKLIDEDNINIHLYQSNKVINKSSDHNDRMIIGIELVVAKHWSDKISHDIKQVYLYKAKQGIPPFRFPIGYLYDKDKKCHYIDKRYENLLRFIFDTFDQGDISINDFVKLLQEKGYKSPTGREWKSSYLHKLLHNRIYSGEFEYADHVWQGKHESYFSPERFQKRLERLQSKYVGKKKRDITYNFSRILKCGHCNRLMSGDMKKDKFVYYIHNCDMNNKGVYWYEPNVIELIDNCIKKIIFTYDFAEILKKLFRNAVKIKKEEEKGSLSLISRKLSELQLKQDKLYDLFADDKIDQESLLRNINNYRKEIDALEKERRAVSVNKEKVLLKIAKIIDNIRDLFILYNNSNPAEKANLLKPFIEYIYIFNDYAEIEWKESFKPILHDEILSIPSLVGSHPLLRAREDSNL